MSTLIDNSRPNITVTNTTTETDVYSVTIPANTLGTAGLIYLHLVGKKIKNAGGVDSDMDMRVYFGGTLIALIPVPEVTVDSASGNTLILDVYLAANGATNAQTAHAKLAAQINQAASAIGMAGDYGTAAIDTTASAILKVTWQQGATPDHSFTSEHGVVLAV